MATGLLRKEVVIINLVDHILVRVKMAKAHEESAQYTTPKLKVYGTVRNLTGGSVATGGGDGAGGMSRLML
jgi:hypothetical protein